MSGDSNDTYEVGYGKPPKSTRFQKGKSGNPSGRPEKRAPKKDAGRILQFIDNEEIAITVDGKRRRMLTGEIYFQQLFARAIKGNLEAARLVARMTAKYFGSEAERSSDVRFKVMPDEYFVRQIEAKESP